jgi:hypothetical protein
MTCLTANIVRAAKISLLTGRLRSNNYHPLNNKKPVTFLFLLSSHPKITTMQRKNWIFLGGIAAVLMTGLLALHSSPAPVDQPTCCEKDPVECTETKNPTGEMPPESLSRQFIFILSPAY